MMHWRVLGNILHLYVDRISSKRRNQSCSLFFGCTWCCVLIDRYLLRGGIKIPAQRRIPRSTRAGRLKKQMRKSTQSISTRYHVGLAFLCRYMLVAPWQPQQLIGLCLLLCKVQVLLCGILVFYLLPWLLHSVH